jgi:hypothetical protein
VTERATLLGLLAAQRASVLAIVDGWDDAALRRSPVPSGWTPLGLVEHLAHAEQLWCAEVVAGVPDPLPWPPPAGPFVCDRPTADVLGYYRDQCARSDAVLAAVPLDAAPRGPRPADMLDLCPDVRTVVLHLIEETARHAGHLDIARELSDGSTGHGPR